jgi:hypothetical protein
MVVHKQLLRSPSQNQAKNGVVCQLSQEVKLGRSQFEGNMTQISLRFYLEGKKFLKTKGLGKWLNGKVLT